MQASPGAGGDSQKIKAVETSGRVRDGRSKAPLRSMFIQQAQIFKNQTSAELSRQVTKIKQEKWGQGSGPRLGGLGAPGAGRERQV